MLLTQMILYHAFSKTFLPTYQCFLYLRASGSIYADERSFFSKSVEVVLMPKNSGFTTNRKERQIGVVKFIDISIHYLDFISTLHRRLIFKVASEKKCIHSFSYIFPIRMTCYSLFSYISRTATATTAKVMYLISFDSSYLRRISLLCFVGICLSTLFHTCQTVCSPIWPTWKYCK